jgi:hypothetical protein
MTITMEERAQNQRLGFAFPRSGDQADARLRELILHIASQCEQHARFGATKLNKILYYADFISFARYGEPITGADYMKLPQGPAPVRLVPVRDDMLRKNEILIRQRPFSRGIQHRIIALREPNYDVFKPRDIALVDEIIHALAGHTADEVSDLSHGIAWRIAGDRDLIPYEAILLAEPVLRPQDIEEAHQLIRKYGWTDV